VSSTAPTFLAVAGNIASGKSTFVRAIAAALEVPALLENPDANPFFSTMPKHAFGSQLHFLLEAVELSASARFIGGVQERTPQEQVAIFANTKHATGALSAHELSVLEAAYAALSTSFRPPELLVYLVAPAGVLLDRVTHRARAAEDDIDLRYLQALEARYSTFVDGWTKSPVLRLDASDLPELTRSGVGCVKAQIGRTA
jgi:deoxyadenosine/deoxycytidine kinase